MRISGYALLSLLTLVLIGLAVPLVIWASTRAMQNVENAPALWVPDTFEQRRNFDWFIETFGYHDIIVISWPDCTVDDRRLERLERQLNTPHRTRHGHWTAKFFRRAHSGYTALRQLMAPPLQLSRDEAIRRLKGSLVGPDGKASCAVVVLHYPEPNARPAIKEALLDVAQEAVGLPPEKFYLGGSIIDGVAIDAENHRSNLYALPSALLSLLLCWICLRSWRLTLPVLIVAAFGEGLMLALVYLLGLTMNAVLAVMAPLVFVLTISAGVHLVNYFLDEARLRGIEGAVSRALAAGWSPCLVAAVTTAIGLGSLTVSDIVPIKQFGALSAVGVLVTLGLLFLLVPGAMAWWGRAKARALGRRSNPGHPPSGPRQALAEGEQVASSGAQGERQPLEQLLARLVCRHAGWVTVICVAVMILGAVGVFRVRTSVSVRSLLVPSSRTIQDYRWLEAHLGPLVPVEIVLYFDRDCPLDMLERLELVRQVQHQISDLPLLGGITSAATFFPDVPAAASSWRRISRRVLLRKRLEREQLQLVKAGWLRQSADGQWWRISARVRALEDLDYGRFLDQLRQRVDPVLDQRQAPGIEATFTGLMPLIYTAQRALLHDLFVSFLTALALVTVVMMLVLRSGGAGLLAMLPNVFPALLLFGGMGWLGINVDIGTMMTASVALGIAVDGTIHFLTWFRREQSNGYSAETAVQRTFSHCSRAMTYTAIICGFGLLVFTLSQFLPTRRFAWMMFTLLVAALAGDLILLPALLVGPAGRILAGAAVSRSSGKEEAAPAEVPH